MTSRHRKLGAASIGVGVALAASCGGPPPTAPVPVETPAVLTVTGAPSASPVPDEATAPTPTRLELVSIDDWTADAGYVSLRAQPDGGSWMMRVRYDATTDRVVGVRSFEGRLNFWEHPIRGGEHLVVRRDNGMLLYPTEDAPPIPIPGEQAWFTPDGASIVTAQACELHLVNASDGTVEKRVPINRRIQTGMVDDDRHFTSACGGSCDEGGGVLRVHLRTGSVAIDSEASLSVRSASGRWIAALVNEIAANGEVSMAAVVWDTAQQNRSRRTALGPWRAEPVSIEFDIAEKNLVLSVNGFRGVNTYTGRTPFASVSLATGARGPAPPSSSLVPEDIVDRWERVEKRAAHLAQSPRKLVPTRRGPGRITAFAETKDRKTAVVLEGDVEPRWGGVNIGQPAALVVDDLRRVRHRIPLPVDQLVVNGITEMSSDDTVAWICLETESGTTLFLLDLATAELTQLPMASCWEHHISSDGMALLAAPYIIDLARRRRLEVSLEATPPPPD